MKIHKKAVAMIAISITLNIATSLAQVGGNNGGDPCEKRFKQIRDNLKAWIEVDNWKGLKFDANDAVNTYKDKMLAAIQKATISCTTDKVYVKGAEKTCSNTTDEVGNITVLCNYDRFMNPAVTDDVQKGLGKDDDSIQYGLVHHEYAGPAGFEIGDYHLSEQLSEKLESVIVKRLPILPVAQMRIAVPQIPGSEGIYCADAYQNKIARMKKNDSWRIVGDAAVYVGMMTAASAPVVVAPVLSILVPVTPLLLAGLYELPDYNVKMIFDEGSSIQYAFNVLLYSKVSVGDLKEIYHDHVVKVAVAKQNADRTRSGLPPLTQHEIALIDAATPYLERHQTGIDVLLKKLKIERTDENYEALRLKILKLSKTNAFCRLSYGKERPVNFMQMVRVFKRLR